MRDVGNYDRTSKKGLKTPGSKKKKEQGTRKGYFILRLHLEKIEGASTDLCQFVYTQTPKISYLS